MPNLHAEVKKKPAASKGSSVMKRPSAPVHAEEEEDEEEDKESDMELPVMQQACKCMKITI